MKYFLLIFLVFNACSCGLDARIPPVEGPSVEETRAVDVSVCDLKSDPAKYNHSVVKVTGYFEWEPCRSFLL